jgi:hypothetical protein
MKAKIFRSTLIWSAFIVAWVCAAFNITLVVVAIPIFTILGYLWAAKDCRYHVLLPCYNCEVPMVDEGKWFGCPGCGAKRGKE